MYKKNIICSFGSKIFTNFKMAACPSFIKMKRPSFVSQKMKLKKDMLPFWYLWIFLSQNFSLCSPCMYLLTLKRIKQFFNLFVSKKPLKNVSFVWKIGLGRFVFSTTVTQAWTLTFYHLYHYYKTLWSISCCCRLEPSLSYDHIPPSTNWPTVQRCTICHFNPINK